MREPRTGAPSAAQHKALRGHASQFFIAGELCQRGHTAVVTLGNTPNVDILCSNAAGTRFAHIHVKTFEPLKRSCSVGMKATRDFGPSSFWILCGIPAPDSDRSFEYYVIPSREMAHHVSAAHAEWLSRPGKAGAKHQDSTIRIVYLPPYKSVSGWDVSQYRDRWDLIDRALQG